MDFDKIPFQQIVDAFYAEVVETYNFLWVSLNKGSCITSLSFSTK